MGWLGGGLRLPSDTMRSVAVPKELSMVSKQGKAGLVITVMDN